MHKIVIILALTLSFGCSLMKQSPSKKPVQRFDWETFTEKQTTHGFVTLSYFSKSKKDSCHICVQKFTNNIHALEIYIILIDTNNLDFPKGRIAIGEFADGTRQKIIHADSCATFDCIKNFKMTWQIAEKFGDELQRFVNSGLSNEHAFTAVLKKWKWY